jgi:hypothetical protein
MKRVLASLTVALALVGVARAQSGGFGDVPTGHFAGDAVSKMAALGVMAPGKAGAKFDGNKPVTRYELALTLWRFAKYLDGVDKQQKGKLKASAPTSGADAVKKLIAEGYLPKNTPLAKEGSKAVTASQLSDALTAVIVQMRARKVPISPDSLHAPITRPDALGA